MAEAAASWGCPSRVDLFSQDLGKLWSENPAEIPLPGQLQGGLLPLCFGLPMSILGCLAHCVGGDVTTPIPSHRPGRGQALDHKALLSPCGEVTRDAQVTGPPGPTPGLPPGAMGENTASSFVPQGICSLDVIPGGCVTWAIPVRDELSCDSAQPQSLLQGLLTPPSVARALSPASSVGKWRQSRGWRRWHGGGMTWNAPCPALGMAGEGWGSLGVTLGASPAPGWDQDPVGPCALDGLYVDDGLCDASPMGSKQASPTKLQVVQGAPRCVYTSVPVDQILCIK